MTDYQDAQSKRIWRSIYRHYNEFTEIILEFEQVECNAVTPHSNMMWTSLCLLVFMTTVFLTLYKWTSTCITNLILRLFSLDGNIKTMFYIALLQDNFKATWIQCICRSQFPLSIILHTKEILVNQLCLTFFIGLYSIFLWHEPWYNAYFWVYNY